MASFGRYIDRSVNPKRHGSVDARSHLVRDRASPIDHPPGRFDSRHGPGPAGREGYSRGVIAGGRTLQGIARHANTPGFTRPVAPVGPITDTGDG